MEQYKSSNDLEKNLDFVRNLKEQISNIEKQEPDKISKISSIQSIIDKLQNDLDSKKTKRDELFKLIEESQNEQEKLDKEQRELRERLEQERETQNQNILIIDRLSNEKNGAEAQIKELEELASERDLPYIFAEDEVIDVDVLREAMHGLKAEFESLPDINMKAVSQYDEELELNQELVEKRKHVERDHEAISNAINDIESEKREKFMVVYNSISKDFNRIFGILSPDGRARLELEFPDDPFAGGIIIMANPGGKKIISMISLSGGEKSLTALAMIFSIQGYKHHSMFLMKSMLS